MKSWSVRFFMRHFAMAFLSNYYVLCVGCMRWRGRGVIHNTHVV